ncbi:arginine--tRNA ligase [Aequorivita antarctica]|uniref:Arginine--tRNA ligase n=1 Tax=Aequorivita antarctica TaxID=153266 RepID=A0A5C6YYT2_9FLAO|nr:arginine--tRNA ligase [Aequorivita antarctica]TXD72312.1 arginine--tRNA ligase [Aequorivita antarctica]SRX74449.1 Arginine--tRNA ligase [Aequorivita antarctica]
MTLQQTLETQIKTAVEKLYGATLESVELQATRKDFEGDITAVVFPMLRVVKGNPVQIGEAIGNYLVENVAEIEKFNVVQGFLNIVLSDAYYLNFFNSVDDFSSFGKVPQGNEAMMVEYSSPNTNKPLHLGHVRNVLLGYSVAEIEKAAGKKVYKTQIINDRGIHICKSMLAWEKFGNGETPDSADLKGDKLVGNYYVKFDKEYKKQIEVLKQDGKTEEEAKVQAPLLKEAQQMLLKWEAGDKETVALWNKMNGWVYKGFEETYKSIGVDFDFYYYESDTYLLGKDIIEEGIKKDVFFMKDDGSVWCDLTEDGLDEKLVLRSDGTAVYMTQDIGTAVQRVKDHPDVGGMIYTVGNEQDYHFKVLFLILKKLGYSWSKNLFHLSYGMVDLPSGKMKSREGTVVDADDLIAQMTETARTISEELGKIDDFSKEEKEQLYKMIGLGALKYYILKVDPKKRILFNPEESVDFQGNTGPFIQYTYARIQSILRKAGEVSTEPVLSGDERLDLTAFEMHPKEKELIKMIQQYPETIQFAAENYSPALIANYTYDLVKEFNSFYQNVPILATDNETEKAFRVKISRAVGEIIKSAFALLGIEVPERM